MAQILAWVQAELRQTWAAEHTVRSLDSRFKKKVEAIQAAGTSLSPPWSERSALWSVDDNSSEKKICWPEGRSWVIALGF